MAAKPSIEVVIETDATYKVTVGGVAGPTCLKLTADLIKDLGGQSKVTKTQEYYAKDKVVKVRQ